MPENSQAIKREVQSFYDRVGWKEVAEGVYQNARFEDLRPVSQEYIHLCHLRVGKFLLKNGHFFLDAGSGPIQYPEYLTYSECYRYRVCVDISLVALIEARKRLGNQGLYVVSDVSALPFCKNVFDGVISLHTLHHLPISDQKSGYHELFRVLAGGRNAVVVNGWTNSPLMHWSEFLIKFLEKVHVWFNQRADRPRMTGGKNKATKSIKEPAGTYVQKFTPEQLRMILGTRIPYEIRCWRSVSVRFLRAVIHPHLAGRFKLRILFWLENRFSYIFGVIGQYPMIILKKPE